MNKILEEIPEKKRARISTTELLLRLVKEYLTQNLSLHTAAKKGVPIVCPME
jgi:deoxyhypusine synthase